MDDPNTQPPVNPQDAPAEATGGQPVDPGYSNEDLKNQSIREIAEGQEPPKPEEKPQEPTPEPPVETAPIPTAEEIAKRTADEIEARAKTEEPTPEPTDKEKIYIEWEKKFREDNTRPPTYLEAMQFVEERAVATIQERQETEAKAQEEEQTRIAKEIEETNKQVNAVVDDELNDLYNANKLTKIQDPNNPSDQGVIERKALFAKWQEVNTQRAAEGKQPILSATRIYEFYYQKPNAQPAGADAPVAGGSGSGTPPSSEQNYSYTDLKKPWSFFRRS